MNTNDSQLDITKEMRDSMFVDGDSRADRIIVFTGINGKKIEIHDESHDYDAQVITIFKSNPGDRDEQKIELAVADFDYIMELMKNRREADKSERAEDAAEAYYGI